MKTISYRFDHLFSEAARGLFLFAVIATTLSGCARSDGAAEVVGDVVLDGAPLAEGVIHFMPIGGQSRTESTFIAGGKFQKRVPVGKHRVEISCVKARALRPGQDADSATGAEIVPAKYNVKSELQAEVKEGENKVRFELSSK